MRPRRISRGPVFKPGFKLWLCGDDPKEVFGGGKWRLLEAIQREGSLRAAAAQLGISYRKAWGDLRNAEDALGVTFLERHRGGSDGGETLLTDEGRRWLREYRRLYCRVEKAVESAFASWCERMER
jgi:molybdate transport system regulatory protein